MTLEGTPLIVSPGRIQDVKFLDEADTANGTRPKLLRRQGVETIVVLLHEGGTQSVGLSPSLDQHLHGHGRRNHGHRQPDQ